MAKHKTFRGTHRNAELAERHRRSLERKLGHEVIIVSRQNSKGQFSARGRNFVFQDVPPEEKDFENLTLEEFENYMDAYDGEYDGFDVETSGDYGEE